MKNDDPFVTIDPLADTFATLNPSPLPTESSGAGSRPKNRRRSSTIKPVKNSGKTIALSDPSNASQTEPSSTSVSPPDNNSKSTNSKSTGRYDRVAELGRGGWGVVDRVRDRELEREVAVKRIGGDGQLGSSKLHAEIRQRFLHEAKITSQLQHPGVVPVHEFGSSENGESYYVMKLLEGDSLRQLIRRQHAPARESGYRWTRFSLQEAISPLLERFIHVCNAVAYAHEKGVIHRDLKPANVMAGAFGETIVVDWGLAKRFHRSLDMEDSTATTEPTSVRSTNAIESNVDGAMRAIDRARDHERKRFESTQHTTQGSIIGTPAYMSPEQASGLVDQLGPASDIYSLGVILYEMIAGRQPYHDLDVHAILEEVKAGRYPTIASCQPLAAKSLAAICYKAMAYDPVSRYSSASEIADDVRRFVAGDAVSVYQEPILDRVARFCRRHQSSCIAVAISTAVLLATSSAFSIVVHRAHQSEKIARQSAQNAHRETIESLSEARDSADSLLVDLSGSLEFYPGMEAIREKLLSSAKLKYEKIYSDLRADVQKWTGPNAAASSDRKNVLAAMIEQSKCGIRLGDLCRLSSNFVQAKNYYLQAEVSLNALSAETSSTQEYDELKNTIHLQRINVLIGKQLLHSGECSDKPLSQDSASKEFERECVWLREQLASRTLPSDERADYASSLSRYQIAFVRSRLPGAGTVHEIDLLEEAKTWARWLAENRGELRDKSLSETIQRELASRVEEANQTERAASLWRQLMEDLERDLSQSEPRPDHLQSLAYARMRYAHVSAQTNRKQQAIDSSLDAIEDLMQAWRLMDSNLFYRATLATAQHNLGKLYADDSYNSKGAEQWLDRSIANYQELLKSDASAETIRSLCEARASLASLLEPHRINTALKHYDDAALGYQMLVDHQLITDEDRLALAETLIARAALHQSQGRPELATQGREAAGRQLEMLEPKDLPRTLRPQFEKAKLGLNPRDP